MGTIAEEITALRQRISQAYDVIDQKGGVVPASRTSWNLPEAISSIPTAGPIPYDSRVEYLQSTGTQWIDTGYTTSNSGYVITAVINNHADTTATQPIFGSWGSSTSTRLQLYKTTGRIGGNYVNFTVPANRKLSVVADTLNVRFVIDGRTYQSSGMTAPTIEIPLQIFNRNNESTKGVFRLYSFTIARGDSPELDLIPVRFTNENGESEGAMFDIITRRLFRNAGTGSFTLGPDVG